MLIFELTNGNLQSAQIEYFDIELEESKTRIMLHTNRGNVTYEVTAAHDTGDYPESIRDVVMEKLEHDYCRIKEYPERKYLYIDALQFTGWRVKSDFLD